MNGASWPSHFSSVDRARALSLLDSFRASLKPYDGTWTADWLVGSAFDPMWQLVRKRNADGNGKPEPFSWDLSLPNGTSLLDSENERMLRTAQKAAFLVRTLPTGGYGTLTSYWCYLYSQATLIRWLYLHAKIYSPSTDSFRRLTSAAIEEFIGRMVLGGVPWVLNYPEAFLAFCYENIACPLPSGLSLTVPDDHRDAIVSWLEANNFYRSGIKDPSQQFLDRRKIAAALGIDVQTIKSHARFSAFLRQFEPSISSPLLVGREYRREFPTHRCLTVSEALTMSYSVDRGMIGMLSSLLRLHRHLPDEVPDSAQVEMRRISKWADRRPAGHTAWVPLDVALAYMREALRWIHVYGPDLVSYVVAVAEALESYASTEQIYANINKREAIVRSIPVPESLAALNISGLVSALSTDCTAFERFRTAPSIGDALSVLVGAIIVILGTMKPSREAELTSLDRDCVYFIDGDGFWLHTKQGKSGVGEYRLESRKPIPAIVAKAVGLMRTLGDGLRRIQGDTDMEVAAPLFYLPERDSVRLSQVMPMTSARINSYLDRFCDWVDLRTDDYGRRWYIRIHEMRKSFLITFFWCYRYGGLDAARWMAGHTNAADVYAYIEANFPGEELPALEAQYAAEQLWSFETGEGLGNTDNAEVLYDKVRKAFYVNTIDLIPENELLAWLTAGFRTGDLDIEAYSIRDSGGILNTRICFRFSEGD